MLGLLKRRRRERLRAEAFPLEWRRIIERNAPLYFRLNAEDRRELCGHVRVFLAEKHFEGCGGLTLTDEIRVTIAAQACILLLHREATYYPQVKTILVYPSTYVAEEDRHIGGGIWEEGEDVRAGHTQHRLGVVVLAWDAALHGSRIPADGFNLVLHEFAHQLDFENDSGDGTPALDSRQQYLSWARVLGEEYDRLRQESMAQYPSLLDHYGATNPAEFFAVATEFFFERPEEMRERHPDLYSELRRFYQQDPAEYGSH